MAEPDGFRAFVQSRQDALLRSAWLLTGDWQQAEDLVQTALVKVWPRWHKITATGDPEAYVRHTVVTTYLTWRRRRWFGEVATDTMPEATLGADQAMAVDLRDALSRILPLLAPRQRAVLVLRFYDDLSVEQTAAALGCSAGTVKSQTSKALARLAAADVKEMAR